VQGSAGPNVFRWSLIGLQPLMPLSMGSMSMNWVVKYIWSICVYVRLDVRFLYSVSMCCKCRRRGLHPCRRRLCAGYVII